MDCINLEANNPKTVRTEVCICISGFLSENSDHYQEWSNVTNYLNQFTDVYFYGWCAETTSAVILDSVNMLLVPMKTTFNVANRLINGNELKTGFIKAKNQAKVCGRILAHILASESVFKFQTITLVGFSLGAHIIKHCLAELYKLKSFDIIQNIVLLAGATKFKNENKWIKIFGNVVNERLVNVFST